MRRVTKFLIISLLVVSSLALNALAMAQAIMPLSGTKGAGAINNGVAQFNQGKLDTALNHFQQALKANPRSAVAHYNLALTFNRMGQSDKAVRHFQKAAKLGRMNPFIQNSRILKQHTQGQQKKR